MNKVKAFLLKLIGRLKENIETFAMTAGTIAIPLGFSFLTIGTQEHNDFIKYASAGRETPLTQSRIGMTG